MPQMGILELQIPKSLQAFNKSRALLITSQGAAFCHWFSVSDQKPRHTMAEFGPPSIKVNTLLIRKPTGANSAIVCASSSLDH
jgi:hypothetical protein